MKTWLACGCALLLFAAWAQSRPANNGFTFAILGDRTGRAAPGIYEQAWKEIAAEHPAFVINVGDTIEGGDDAKAEAEWNALKPLWSGHPTYFVPGNHDIFSAASRKIYEQQTRHPASYSFNYQTAHFTILDNSQTEDLDEAELEFLRQDLEKNAAKSPKFIFFHRPFWIPYILFKSGDFPLHRIAKKYGVTAIINGHTHQLLHMPYDGITYLIVGSSGGSISRGLTAKQGLKEGWFYQHVSAQVIGVQVKFTIKQVNGRTFRAEEWGRTGLQVP